LLKNFTNKLENIFSSKKIDENSLSELEEILLISDVGIETVDKIISMLRNAKFSMNFDIAEVKSKLSEIILNIVEPYQTRLPTINSQKPMAILCVGVNGSGKTTTVAKLAHFYKKFGYSGILGAADTFRAAASEQLSEWAQKLNLKIISSKQNADPASVSFETIDYTLNNSFNLCLIDTAGRLQNRSDLMEELKKLIKL
jgi:fused signal recognition particle receptor